MLNEVLVTPASQAWLPMMDGICFKLLRTCDTTGAWTVLFQCQPGCSFPRHRHYGAGEYYVITGHMVYRAGEAKAGDYGYEPLGVVHDLTSFPEYTELYFTNFGPVVFLDDNDAVISILDHTALRQMAGLD